ncbi:MAG: uracil-DNA glycosylase family protein [Spirochaetota bacterium]
MKSGVLKCTYPCADIHGDFIYPAFPGDKNKISILMISESPPIDRSDYFYEKGDGAFFKTTQAAFRDAGADIGSYEDLTALGIYLTTAIKCPKAGYLVSAKTIRECSSRYLADEIAGFKNVRVIMCMGDFAVKAVNYIFKNAFNASPMPQGAIYKIRKEPHELNGIRFIPSYTQTGDSFNIERSKRQMIAEDIKCAMNLTGK